MQELWKPIPGYEDAYEVSDQGRVRSVTRKVPYGRHPGMTYKGRLLKQTKTKNGYLTVKLAKKGITKTTYVHDLVLQAFCGARPQTEKRGEIRHRDGCKIHNRLGNLKYGTIDDNALDRRFHEVFGNVARPE